ncbi:hypothetical protein Taro_028180 [Colocasia esculenta]|uniref:Derlin n=1 Tax=Colocasia esculenta TaxID=4460 RepID=A0A843VAK5_COLES|nr:hypothetical protein [Colocasia esculenta]
MAQAVEEWYKQMPIITRSYLTAAVVTTVGCSLEIISPYKLYLNPKLVLQRYEIWRLITNFLYFRKMDLDFLFHMFFLARYCKLLEENSFRGRTADFFYMLLFGATVLTGIVFVGGMIPYVSESFAKIIFLSNSLTFMMVYVWSKQNPFIPMSFLGLFTFTAAYLPWVLLGFSVLVGASTWVDLLGMVAGHAYYFLEYVYPQMTGRRPLKTPSFIKSLFSDDTVVVTPAANVRFAPPQD